MPSEGVAVVGRVCLPGELLGRAHELQLSGLTLPQPGPHIAQSSLEPASRKNEIEV